ncbi:unnamed protein product [Protopolystoma xenopodis]|uniref:Uncharacterized protein n=1 Tax=Protopolystoma xenopodis TaxID=117903 RepID=A0A3S5CN46_9PLAT|nr:unnamed protein product [Protopolystoma xenopodis]
MLSEVSRPPVCRVKRGLNHFLLLLGDYRVDVSHALPCPVVSCRGSSQRLQMMASLERHHWKYVRFACLAARYVVLCLLVR